MPRLHGLEVFHQGYPSTWGGSMNQQPCSSLRPIWSKLGKSLKEIQLVCRNQDAAATVGGTEEHCKNLEELNLRWILEDVNQEMTAAQFLNILTDAMKVYISSGRKLKRCVVDVLPRMRVQN